MKKLIAALVLAAFSASGITNSVTIGISSATLVQRVSSIPALQVQTSNSLAALSSALVTVSNVIAAVSSNSASTLATASNQINAAVEAISNTIADLSFITPAIFAQTVAQIDLVSSNSSQTLTLITNALVSAGSLAISDYNQSLEDIDEAVVAAMGVSNVLYGWEPYVPRLQFGEISGTNFLVRANFTNANYSPINLSSNLNSTRRYLVSFVFKALSNTTVSIRTYGETNAVASNSMNCVYIPQGQMAEMICNTDTNATVDVKATGATSMRITSAFSIWRPFYP